MKVKNKDAPGRLPLFDQALDWLMKSYAQVEQLMISDAIQGFQEYLRVFPSDVEVTNALSSLHWLARSRPDSPFPSEDELFSWWRKIEKDAERYRILDTRLFRALKKGILTRLVEKMVLNGQKRIRNIPLGILYFELEQFPEAIRELRLAVGEKPDSSALLGPLAEAEFRTGQQTQSEGIYGLALLYEPQQAGFNEFSHPDISNVQKKLEIAGMAFDLARENLLVQCWLEGVLRLPPLPSASSLHSLIERARKLEPEARCHGRLVLIEDARMFRWCLQITEWIRTAAPNLSDSREWAHHQMLSRDPKAYQTYKERLRLEALQSEETVEVRLGAT